MFVDPCVEGIDGGDVGRIERRPVASGVASSAWISVNCAVSACLRASSAAFCVCRLSSSARQAASSARL
ncbi:MAG: hypothetical protein AB7Q76_12955, partial [Gammaproteobacteria bacterium]